jgi:hypothetical protein
MHRRFTPHRKQRGFPHCDQEAEVTQAVPAPPGHTAPHGLLHPRQATCLARSLQVDQNTKHEKRPALTCWWRPAGGQPQQGTTHTLLNGSR